MECLSERISRTLKDGTIIPIGELKEIWSEKELDDIVGVPLDNDQFQFAQNNLLRTISLLAYLEVSNFGSAVFQWIKSKKEWDQQLHTAEYNDFGLDMSDLQQRCFLSARKYFTALVLTEGEDTILKDGQVMPLIERKPLGGGANGGVTGHKIPLGHLIRKKTGNTEDVLVAKKTLYEPNSKEEILVLKKLRRSLIDKNIRICTCITMITEEPNVHSLSDQSDLNLEHKLLELDRDKAINETYLLDSIGQMKGIAGAVKFLHNTFSDGPGTCFCHMDIKPPNILVFNSSSTVGKWKITDFGISSMSKQRSSKTEGGPREEDQNKGQRITVTVGTSARQLMGRYQPPEVNYYAGGGAEGTVGRGSDVWALACVFSEVLAANLNQLSELRMNMGKHSNFFYEERRWNMCLCRVWKLHCPRHKLNSFLVDWLEKHLQEKPHLQSCKKLIAEMMELKRMRRLKSDQLVVKMQRL